jgi:hypothetical protein
MQQGFWWEYVARVHRRGFSIRELPVHHRLRSAGTTQVHKLRKLPGIGWRHVLALFRILKKTPLLGAPIFPNDPRLGLTLSRQTALELFLLFM